MMRRIRPDEFTTRQKIALFHGTSGPSSEECLSLDDATITYDFLLKAGATMVNTTAAGIGFLRLKQMGATEAKHAKRLGADALHLVDSTMCSEAVAAWGAAEVVNTFLVEPRDAAALAGADAVELLGLTPARLLEACAGAPQEAAAVVEQLGIASLKGLTITRVLDCGLRAKQLRALGVGPGFVATHCIGNKASLAKLEFSLI